MTKLLADFMYELSYESNGDTSMIAGSETPLFFSTALLRRLKILKGRRKIDLDSLVASDTSLKILIRGLYLMNLFKILMSFF